jgi:hypothetical protein
VEKVEMFISKHQVKSLISMVFCRFTGILKQLVANTMGRTWSEWTR